MIDGIALGAVVGPKRGPLAGEVVGSEIKLYSTINDPRDAGVRGPGGRGGLRAVRP